MSKRYYDDHEGAYLEIREKGEYGWQKPALKDFRDPKIDNYLAQVVDKYIGNTAGKTALDLGCGTGPTSHTLFDLGFKTTGIDVSPTAIELAQKFAAEMNKDITFKVEDVLHVQDCFDFIYDSHCYHCIVLEEDRKFFLSTMAQSISRGGILLLDTMAYQEGYDPAAGIATLRFDSDYILWHKTQDAGKAGVEEFEGELWCPQRRIYPKNVVLEEISDCGLTILHHEEEAQGPGQPLMLKIVVSL